MYRCSSFFSQEVSFSCFISKNTHSLLINHQKSKRCSMNSHFQNEYLLSSPLPKVRCRPLFLSSPSHVSHSPRLNTAAIDFPVQSDQLKIAIVGFDEFGQFLVEAFVRHGHLVLAHSRTDYSQNAAYVGVLFFQDTHSLCEQQPDIIILCTSIISTDLILRTLPLDKLKSNTLFVDVLSVKVYPRNVFLQVLPTNYDILCTHPMFGPESVKDGWKGLVFMFDKVRISEGESRRETVHKFLDIFAKEGCKMVPMTCEEHDKYVARSQFLTHTIGRVLEKLELETTPMNTKGYQTLMDLVKNTTRDSFDLYYGSLVCNKHAWEQLKQLELAFRVLKKELYGKAEEAGQMCCLPKTEL